MISYYDFRNYVFGTSARSVGGAWTVWDSPFLVTCFVHVLLQCMISTVDGTSLAPIHWTHTNPMFKTSKNDHVIEVKQYDDIDYVCPYTEARLQNKDGHAHLQNHDGHAHESHTRHNEYYIVYMVSRAEYDDCNIHQENKAMVVLNCSNPQHRKRFTILFEPFQSIPNAPEYHPGSTYYFITTSTGSRDGLNNLYQGACYHHNMKLMIKVCCDSSSTDSISNGKDIFSNTIAEPKVIHRQPYHSRHNQTSRYGANHSDRQGISHSDRQGTSRNIKSESHTNRLKLTSTTSSSTFISKPSRSRSLAPSPSMPKLDDGARQDRAKSSLDLNSDSNKFAEDLLLTADDASIARQEGLVNTGSGNSIHLTSYHFLFIIWFPVIHMVLLLSRLQISS